MSNDIKYQQFSFACDEVRGLIRNDWSVREAISYVAEVIAKEGQWDEDDLTIELYSTCSR